MNYYIKVVDGACGVGWSRGYWTRRGADKAAADLRSEFGTAWIYTSSEYRNWKRACR